MIAWRLRELMSEASAGQERRMTYEAIHEETGTAVSTLSQMATQRATRTDLEMIERLLTYFQPMIARPLNTADLLEWTRDA